MEIIYEQKKFPTQHLKAWLSGKAEVFIDVLPTKPLMILLYKKLGTQSM